jgi:benzoate membrane transport protein
LLCYGPPGLNLTDWESNVTFQIAPGAAITMRIRQTVPAIVAGFLVVLVSYSGPFLFVQLAAKNAHLTGAQTDGWIFACSVGSGLAGIGLSLWSRQPIVVAFNSAGAVLLVTSLQEHTFSDAIGAYIVVGLVSLAIGLTRSFSRLMARLPGGVVAAMLAGVLFRFGTGYFEALPGKPQNLRITAMVVIMGVAYFVSRVRGSRLAIVWTSFAGAVAAVALGLTTSQTPRLHLASLQLTVPTFHLSAMTGLALPLFALVISSQYAPGYAVLKGSGYEPNMDRVLSVTGAVSALFAPLGGPGVNLSAITAGIATGPDAHADQQRRYLAGIAAGCFYVVAGLFGASLLSIFTVMPKEFVAAVTGLALFGTIAGSAATALAEPAHRDAAAVALMCAASGFSLFHIGAPFWALVLGLAVDALSRSRLARRPR